LAGVNIRKTLLQDYPFRKLVNTHVLDNITLLSIDEDTINVNDIEMQTNADIFVFATRHQSAQGRPVLSVHAPGNWGIAKMGGRDRKLCTAPASLMKSCLQNLNHVCPEGFEITMEQTHHGPLLYKPCMFIEIGSSIIEWNQKAPAKALCMALIRSIREYKKTKAAVMLGGGHYNHQANKIMLKSDYAIGHICSKHNLGEFDMVMLKQAIDKTVEHVEFIILDWKGLGEYKKEIMKILENSNIPYKKAQEF